MDTQGLEKAIFTENKAYLYFRKNSDKKARFLRKMQNLSIEKILLTSKQKIINV